MEQKNTKNNNGNTTWASLSSNTKHLIIAGIAIVIVIALAIIIPHIKKANAPATAPAVTPVTMVPASTATTATADSAKETAWQAMLDQYTGKLILFTANCTAVPATQTHTVGTKILLVNDSSVPHSVFVGSNGYTIGAYHYKTTVLETSDNLIVSCDKNQNAATITVN
jgi:hypothetical protein